MAISIEVHHNGFKINEGGLDKTPSFAMDYDYSNVRGLVLINKQTGGRYTGYHTFDQWTIQGATGFANNEAVIIALSAIGVGLESSGGGGTGGTINTVGLATSSLQNSLNTKIDATNALLTDAKTLATQNEADNATLIAELNAQEVLLTAIRDGAGADTTTLSDIKTINDAVKTAVEALVVNSDQDEAKQIEIKDGIDALNVSLATLKTEHDETQAAIAAAEAAQLLRDERQIDLLELNNWDKVAGNNREIVYYPSEPAGTTAGNPSGNKNAQSIAYKKAGVTVFTQTFTYDSDDDVINITAT